MEETYLESNNHTTVDCKPNNCWEEEIHGLWDLMTGYNTDKEVWEGRLPVCSTGWVLCFDALEFKRSIYIHFTSQIFRWLLGQIQCIGRFCLIYTFKKNFELGANIWKSVNFTSDTVCLNMKKKITRQRFYLVLSKYRAATNILLNASHHCPASFSPPRHL